jgi:hypothetical protein
MPFDADGFQPNRVSLTDHGTEYLEMYLQFSVPIEFSNQREEV